MKDETYICSKCKIEKPISEFGKARDRTRGHRSQCKYCLKEYEKKNKLHIQERKRVYRQTHKEKLAAKRHEYYLNNKDKVKEYELQNADRIKEVHKAYRESNKELINKNNRVYQKANLDKFRVGNKKHYKKNKANILKKGNEWKINKINSDPLYKLKVRTRTLVYCAFKNKTFKKGTKTTNILDCSFKEFKKHIESQFESWMTWDNYGMYNGEFNYGWDLDHIIPISTASTEEDVIKLNHYTNFQPLCSHTNRNIKKDKLNWKTA